MGCGIKKANLHKIFDPFFTTKKSAEWAGIGLTLANLMVRNQQGKIEVQSKPGKAPFLVFTFPSLSHPLAP
ncbi:hypothetical protein GWO43_05045 [candidate division KSB1 bacterium]|nr:hypothetical protein [candidate division KSB1 bacterium]NIR71450.1 hypothetical protein [candidate division KSB1 bacterium]NIS23371.1 hypothetical protein [candidate division KSB1 bacterium]NIT70262.1 hypothetical protein [candidate division KSB1 bacterium]NIU23985.1 hypothetical protein [candidate division KSB1 bacterium]